MFKYFLTEFCSVTLRRVGPTLTFTIDFPGWVLLCDGGGGVEVLPWHPLYSLLTLLAGFCSVMGGRCYPDPDTHHWFSWPGSALWWGGGATLYSPLIFLAGFCSVMGRRCYPDPDTHHWFSWPGSALWWGGGATLAPLYSPLIFLARFCSVMGGGATLILYSPLIFLARVLFCDGEEVLLWHPLYSPLIFLAGFCSVMRRRCYLGPVLTIDSPGWVLFCDGRRCYPDPDTHHWFSWPGFVLWWGGGATLTLTLTIDFLARFCSVMGRKCYPDPDTHHWFSWPGFVLWWGGGATLTLTLTIDFPSWALLCDGEEVLPWHPLYSPLIFLAGFCSVMGGGATLAPPELTIDFPGRVLLCDGEEVLPWLPLYSPLIFLAGFCSVGKSMVSSGGAKVAPPPITEQNPARKINGEYRGCQGSTSSPSQSRAQLGKSMVSVRVRVAPPPHHRTKPGQENQWWVSGSG